HLEEFFIKMRKANFFMKLRKCEFLMSSMEYLGHTVTSEGITPSEAKIKAVVNMPVPQNASDIRRFLRMGGFYRKYICNFSQRTWHLRQLTKSDIEWNWTTECQKELDDITSALTSHPVMAYPDWSKDFIITTDASGKGVG